MPNFENITPTRIELPELGILAEPGEVVAVSAETAAIIGDSHPDLSPTKAKASTPATTSSADTSSASTESADAENITSAADAATTEGA